MPPSRVFRLGCNRLALPRSWRYLIAMLRALPSGFIAPCLCTGARQVPASPQWAHEIQHDGFRFIVRRDGGARSACRAGTALTGPARCRAS
jgi:ATP-dependent DNA ligase